MAASRRDLVLGMDLGGTKLLTLLTDRLGRVLERKRVDTPAWEGTEAVLEAMVTSARGLLERSGCPPDRVLGLGIGAPGLVDPETGTVVEAPNLFGWRNVPVRDHLAGELGIPTSLENDANVLALGEHRWGAGRGVSDLLYITVSTGIGGGLILGGRLYGGASSTAGEVGHIPLQVDGPPCGCGNHGCLEALASGTALARAARDALKEGAASLLLEAVEGVESVDAEAVFRAAAQGDALATGIVERGAFYLGLGLTTVVNLLNPELIVVGGGLSMEWDAYVAPALRVMRLRAFTRPAERVRVIPAALREEAGALGAVVLALDTFG